MVVAIIKTKNVPKFRFRRTIRLEKPQGLKPELFRDLDLYLKVVAI